MALGLKKKSKAAPAKSEPKRRLSIQQHKPVNTRRQAFIDHYLATNNATKAAKLAGYSKKTARQAGTRLLSDPAIGPEVARRQAAMREVLVVTADRVKAEVAKLAFSNLMDYMEVAPDGSPQVNFKKMTREQAAALQSVTVEEFVDGRSDKRQVRRVKFQVADKSKNLENLMKHFGMLKEVMQVNHHHDITVMGVILKEIDEESRAKVIEHK